MGVTHYGRAEALWALRIMGGLRDYRPESSVGRHGCCTADHPGDGVRNASVPGTHGMASRCAAGRCSYC